MAESIFTSQTPSTGNANDDTTYTLGTVWTPAVDGTVTHMRMYAPTTAPGGPVVGVLYRIDSETTGVELGRATFGTLSLGGWNTVALTSPVPVVVGSYYVASYITPDRFVLTLNLFAAAPVVSGNLTAVESGLPYGNGRLHEGDGFPEAASSSRACYFADVVFEAGAPEPDPARGSAGVGVDLAVDAIGGRASAGLAGVGLALAVAAAGHAPEIVAAAGSAGLGITLAVSAHGRAPGTSTGGRGETVVIVRTSPGGKDPYGDPLPSTVERIPMEGCIVADGATSAAFGLEPAVYGRDPIVTDYLVLPPADAPEVLHTDQAEIRGLLCDVVGRPFFWRNPLTGTAFGSQFRANAAEG